MMLAPRSFLFSRHASLPNASNPPKAKGTERRNERARGAKQEEDSVAKQAAPRDMLSTLTPTTPTTTTLPVAQAATDPVIIPVRTNRESSRDGKRHPDSKDAGRNEREQERQRRAHRARDIHSPDAIPPSVAALLALTSIPPQKMSGSPRRGSRPSRQMTVDAILQHTTGSERELSLSLGKTHLDFLLTPPEEQMMDHGEAVIGSDTGRSYFSSRTLSSDSVPSLDGSSIEDSSLSLVSFTTPSPRGKRSLPRRRRLQSLSPSMGEKSEEHPLSGPELDIDELDFRVFRPLPPSTDQEIGIELPITPRRKSAFKSNLTASLKALKSAARTFSSMTTPMLTPDDFLTRSIISIDPRVPFTDERMPPKLEDTPTPALRRYLNPTTNAPIEAHVPTSLAQTSRTMKCTASIQMQTYRVSKTGKSDPPNVISRRTRTNSPEEVFAEVAVGPVARQRDMRENSDFIRVAVMEMMMRRHGKLDEKVPGRAKWALPPRKISSKTYEIGEGGVPTRWIASTI